MIPLQKVEGFTKPSSTLTTELQVSKAKVSARVRDIFLFSLFLGVPALRRSGYPLNLFLGAVFCPKKKDTAAIPNAHRANPKINSMKNKNEQHEKQK